MICCICGKPATGVCDDCGRYICNEHSHQYKYQFPTKIVFMCSDCDRMHRKDVYEEEERKRHKKYYCYIHKCYHDDDYLRNDRWKSFLGIVKCHCGIKQFCADSAVYGGDTKIIDGWNTYYDNYADGYTKRYIYLCPICKKPVFYHDFYYKKGRSFIDEILERHYYDSSHFIEEIRP